MQALFEPNRKKFMAMLLLTAISDQLINLAMPAFRSVHMGVLALGWIVLFSIGYVSDS